MGIPRDRVRRPIERAGNRSREAGAHQHIVRVRQHRAIQRWQGGELAFSMRLMPTAPAGSSLAGKPRSYAPDAHAPFIRRPASGAALRAPARSPENVPPQ
jgi:hypothetical protein